MQPSALVTGSAENVPAVGDALEAAGFQVVRAAGRDALPAAVAGIGEGSLSCYVQLPRRTEVSGDSLVDRVRQFLAEGLLARFDAASAVLPKLAPDGYVVLVAGNVPGDTTPDDRHARIDLLRVLARAILAERGEKLGAIVVGNERTPAEIAEIALNRGEDEGKVAQVAAIDPELSYADWHREFLHLTTEER
jgi:hypothetical protein